MATVAKEIVLVNNPEKYAGNYVATASFQDKDPICFGPKLLDVYREAVSMGVKDPVVFYVPEKDISLYALNRFSTSTLRNSFTML
jgi:hypothetical protein